MRGLLSRFTGTLDVHIECRHCGTDVSRETARCPTCHGTEFARYDLTSG